MNKVLLLNQHYLPLNIIKMNRAIKMYCKGKVEILEGYGSFNYDGKEIQMPIIMRMKYFVNISKKKVIKEYSKLNVWKRDKSVCQYCGKYVTIKDYTVDHVYPKKLGGTNDWTNVVTACFECNNKKDCKTLKDSGMTLINKPKVPKVYDTIEQTILQKFRSIKEIPYESWKYYLR